MTRDPPLCFTLFFVKQVTLTMIFQENIQFSNLSSVVVQHGPCGMNLSNLWCLHTRPCKYQIELRGFGEPQFFVRPIGGLGV